MRLRRAETVLSAANHEARKERHQSQLPKTDGSGVAERHCYGEAVGIGSGADIEFAAGD
jgi:hypothetical protein